MRWAEHVLGSAKNTILALAALIAALGTIIGAGKHILSPSEGKSTAPTTPVARFEEAKVDPEVLLEQYEADYLPGALASLHSSDPRSPSYRPATDVALVTIAGTTSVGQVEDKEGTGTTGGGTTSTGEPSKTTSELGGTAGERTTSGTTETGEKTTGGSKETKSREEAAARAKAKEEAQAQAKRREAEERAEKKEVAEEEARARRKSHHGRTAPPGGERYVQGYRRFVAPHASPRAFHREGGARVAVGTGEPTRTVDAVLREVKAILAAEGVRPSDGNDVRRNAALQSPDPADGVPYTVANPVATVVVPAGCNESCALRPTIEQAIRDYSSNLTQAAREIAAIFIDTRFENVERRREQVGAVVRYRFDLSGYQGKLVDVVWTLWSKATGRPPPRAWWRNVIVKQVVPSSANAYVHGKFWAPLPQKPGDYTFKLTLYAPDGEEIEQTETTPTFP
jgi:hypothetical protein